MLFFFFLHIFTKINSLDSPYISATKTLTLVLERYYFESSQLKRFWSYDQHLLPRLNIFFSLTYELEIKRKEKKVSDFSYLRTPNCGCGWPQPQACGRGCGQVFDRKQKFWKNIQKKKRVPPLLFLDFKGVAVGVCGWPQNASLRSLLRRGISTAIRGSGNCFFSG